MESSRRVPRVPASTWPRVAVAIWALTVACTVLLLGLGLASVLLATPSSGASSGTGDRPRAASRSSTARTWSGVATGGRWVRSGLQLQTDALLRDPRRLHWLYAGTTDGIWLSTDGGTTWRRDGRGLAGMEIFALAALDPNGAILAGASDGAIYMAQSEQGGVVWRRVSPRLGANPIFSLAGAPTAAPDGARTVLAGTIGALYRGVEVAGRWVWRPVARTDDSAVTSIAWAAWDGRLAFASVFGTSPPVLVTRDGGATWHADDRGLPPVLPTQALLALALGQRSLVVLSTMGDGVWERTATGTWHNVDRGLPQHHAMPLIDITVDGALLLYAGTMGEGVYVRDGETSWRLLSRGLDGGAAYTALSLAAIPAPHPALLAGTARGVYRYVPPA